jgi:hypothetical protein
MNYTTEVEFLRAEVEKCHASMHSQIETINLLMKRNIELQQKRQWVGLTEEDHDAMRFAMVFIKLLDLKNGILDKLQPAKEEVLSLLAERLEQSKLKEKNV